MAWQGFVTESMKYQNYPKCGRWYFWKRFPKAFVRFYIMEIKTWHFMNYYSGKLLLDEYDFKTFDIEDKGSQKSIDELMEELFSKEMPHAIYVTGSRVFKIARSIQKLKMKQKPLLIGHDLVQANIDRVMDESIDFLIEEEAKRQGYLAVESMIRSILYKEKIEKKQFMNLLIYTRENLPSDHTEQA